MGLELFGVVLEWFWNGLLDFAWFACKIMYQANFVKLGILWTLVQFDGILSFVDFEIVHNSLDRMHKYLCVFAST